MSFWKISIYFACLILFTNSCEKDNVTEIDFHYEYYPLSQGTFVVYEAMEIAHDIQALNSSDTNVFYLKTVLGPSILDNSGSDAHEFYRFKKSNWDDDWTLSDVWTVKKSDYRIELVEENERIVKLVFPTNKSKLWDVNAYNTKPRLLARYHPDLIHSPKSISNIDLDSTIQVEEQDFFSLVDHRRKYEIYAKNIGLVYKFYKDNDINNFDTLNIRYGREIHYKMIDFGVE
jgi:hypothetical protein